MEYDCFEMQMPIPFRLRWQKPKSSYVNPFDYKTNLLKGALEIRTFVIGFEKNHL